MDENSTRRASVLTLPPEIRLIICDFIFTDVWAYFNFIQGGIRIDYHPRWAPALLQVCHLIHCETQPILRDKLRVQFRSLHLRSIQQRALFNGSSPDIRSVCPVLTWVRHIQFSGSYNIGSGHPALSECRGLETVSVNVALDTSHAVLGSLPHLSEDAICRKVARLVQLVMTVRTGLGKRVRSAKASVFRRHSSCTPWVLERIFS
jgi:hypothetical protein